MESIEFSTDTFPDEGDTYSAQQEPVFKPTNDIIMQENQNLHKMNEQLQGTVEKLKVQLHDALNAVEKSNMFSDQIQQLKDQLQEARALNEQYQKEIEQSKSMNITNTNDNIEPSTNENPPVNEEIAKLQNKIDKMKKDMLLFKQIDAEKTETIDLLSSNVIKLKSMKKKMKKKILSHMDQMDQVKAALEQAKSDCQKEQDQRLKLANEIDDLKFKIETIEMTNCGLKDELIKAQKEISEKNSAIMLLQKQFEQQADELFEYDTQRNLTYEVLAKMNKLSILNENQLKQQQISLIQLKAQQNASNRQESEKSNVNIFNRANILDLKLPFQGEIKESLEKILKLVQYDPVQRLQLILNELAKQIDNFEKEQFAQRKQINDLKAKQTPENKDSGNYKQILASLLSEFKKLCSNDDKDVKDFVASSCEEFEPILQEMVQNDPNFESNSYFAADDAEKRKEMIKKILDADNLTSDVLIAQVLLSKYKKPQQVSEREPDADQNMEEEQINSENPNDDLQNKILLQEQQIIKLKDTRRKMHENIKKLQASKLEFQVKDSEQKSKINKLELDVDNLQRENNILQMRINVLNNEIQIKNSLINDDNEKKDQETNMQHEMKEKIMNLESELSTVTQENKELTSTNKKLQTKLDLCKQSHTKAVKKLEESYVNKIKDLENKITVLEQKSTEKRRSMKKNLLAIKAQYEETIMEINEHFNTIRASLEENVSEMSQKLSDNHVEIQSLTEKLKMAQSNVENLEKQVYTLSTSKDQCEEELNRVKSDYSRDKKALQAKITTMNFQNESQMNERVQNIERKCNTRIENIIHIVSDTIGNFYNIEDNSLTESTLQQLLLHAKGDLDKLKYFQNESLTKDVNNKE